MFGFGKREEPASSSSPSSPEQRQQEPSVSTKLCSDSYNGKYPTVGLYDCKSRKIWVCPSDPDPKNAQAGYSRTPNIWGVPTPNSYGVNMLLFPYVVNPGDPCTGDCKSAIQWFANNQPRRLATLETPSRMYAISDSSRNVMEPWWVDVCTRYANWSRYYDWSIGGGGIIKSKFPDRVNEDRIYRHNKGSIIVFADGHAAGVLTKELPASFSDADLAARPFPKFKLRQ